jgi:hypothetical protein
MHLARESVFVRLLRWLAESVYRYPRLWFYPQVLLFVLCIAYTVLNLEFKTNRKDMVGEDQVYHRNYQEYKREFQAEDELVAVVEGHDLEKNRQFVERLGARLLLETNLFTDVIFNNDVKMLGNKALLFFPESNLEELRDTLGHYRPFLEQFSQATNLTSLFRLLNRQFRMAKREDNAQNRSLVKALPAFDRIMRQATDSLRRPGLPPSPGLTALFDAGEKAQQQIYLTFNHGRIFLLTARAQSVGQNRVAVRRMAELLEQVRAEVPGVNAALTGEPVLEYDEMQQSQQDATLATIVSLVVVALIFIYGYQQTGRPIKATICLVVGLAYTMGFTTGTIGHLNILTITFVPMLVGLAIDFSVHLISRFEEELRHGRTEREALEKAMVYTGQGIFTGCFTTAGAFLAMGFTDFRGIQEMGLICGGGLLVCLVPMMTLLPVLLLRGRQNLLDHQAATEEDRRARIERWWLDRPLMVVALTLLVTAWAAARFHHVSFDYNLLNLQTRGLPAVLFERKLIEEAGKSVLSCAVITPSLEEAVRLQAQITNLPSVDTASAMAPYLMQDPTRKLELIGQIKRELASLTFATPDPAPVELTDLSVMLYSTQGYLGAAAKETEKAGEVELTGQLRALRQSIGEFRKQMLVPATAVAVDKVGRFQRALFRDIRETFLALQQQDDRAGLRVEDLPPAMRHRFVSRSGQLHMIQVFPKKDVWERANQIEFVNELRAALDPKGTNQPIITGTPVQLMEYIELLKTSYEEAAYYSLAAIAVLVFVHFRSLTSVVLALLPVSLGTFWMLGFMGWFNVPFNPANMMTLPLVIGVGVTSGIHILNRFAEEQTPSIFARSTGKAVLISALTTMVGFGSLLFGKHQGMASLGYVMTVGTGTCMLAALTFLPALLSLRNRWRARRADRPPKATPGDYPPTTLFR